jgi:hypothetical protein
MAAPDALVMMRAQLVVRKQRHRQDRCRRFDNQCPHAPGLMFSRCG